MKIILNYSILVFIITSLAGCTSTTNSAESPALFQGFNGVPVLPQDANRIFIAPIHNNTSFRQGESLLRNRLGRLISREGRLSVIESETGADLLLKIAITSYSVQPLTYDRNGRLDRQRLRITVSSAMNDCQRNRLIFRENGIQAFLEFSEITFPIRTQAQTAEEVVSLLADRLYSKIKSGWYTEHLTDIEKRK